MGKKQPVPLGTSLEETKSITKCNTCRKSKAALCRIWWGYEHAGEGWKKLHRVGPLQLQGGVCGVCVCVSRRKNTHKITFRGGMETGEMAP